MPILSIAFGSQSLLRTTSDLTGSVTNWRTEGGDQRGAVNESWIKFFFKNWHISQVQTPKPKPCKKVMNTHQPPANKWSPQSYKASGRRMRSNRHSVSKIWPKRWMNVELKLLVGQCLAQPYIVRLGLTMSNWRSLEKHEFLPKFAHFFPTLILEV
jgi:hypothetical protein